MEKEPKEILPKYEIDESKTEKARIVESEDEERIGKKERVAKIPEWIWNEAHLINEALEKKS